MERMLRVDQVADIFQTSIGTVRKMLPMLGAVDLNQGGSGKRLIRIPESKVLQFLQGSVIHEVARPRVATGPRQGFTFERRRA